MFSRPARRMSAPVSRVVRGWAAALPALAALLIVAGFPGVVRPAAGQCAPGWVPNQGAPGVIGSEVYGAANLPGGKVAVFGRFTSAAGVQARNVAFYTPALGSGPAAWSGLGAGPANGPDGAVNAAVGLANGDVVVGGAFATAGGVPANNIARWTAATGQWSALGAGVQGTVNALALLADGRVAAGGDFASAGGLAASNVAIVNPSTGAWAAAGAGVNGNVWALAVSGSDLWVGGDFLTAGGMAGRVLARYRPSTGAWTAYPGASGSANSIGLLSTGSVVAAGSVYPDLAAASGSGLMVLTPGTGAWAPLAGPQVWGDVSALAVLPGDDLVAIGTPVDGGRFFRKWTRGTSAWTGVTLPDPAGVVQSTFLLRLASGELLLRTGTPAAPLQYALSRYTLATNALADTGFGAPVTSVTGLAGYSMAMIPGGDLLVGGDISRIGTVFASGVARYSPATGLWSRGANGSVGVVYAIAPLAGGAAVIAGFGGGPSNPYGAARLDTVTGNAASIAPGPLNGLGWAATPLPGGDVMIGGVFPSTSGTRQLARYAPAPAPGTWTPILAGPNGTVRSLATLPGGDVIVAGFFSSAAGVAASGVARWNPGTGAWSALGAGIVPGLLSATALSDGDVVFGGVFASAGGVPAINVARYRPSTGAWSALGGGTNGRVRVVLELPGGDLAVGGDFTAAGGVPANRLARYTPGTGAWSALGGPGLDGPVWSLALLPGGDLAAGGEFRSAGGLVSGGFARYSSRSACRADYDCMNGADLLDIFAFLLDWFAGAPAADIDSVGGVDLLDIFAFLAVWFTGC